jgi:DnaJ-class molecular chaperone
MAWQKCPVCNGTGKNYGGLQSSAICPTCNGQRIISEVTGLPPALIAYYNTNTTDLTPRQALQKAIDNELNKEPYISHHPFDDELKNCSK